MTELIKQIVSEYLGNNDIVEAVQGLYGDASYRRYFRVSLISRRSVIVMKMPEGKSSVSEEISNYEGPKDELPYINVSRYLKKAGLPVPEILYYDKERKALVLEDIGDNLLYDEVSMSNEEIKFWWYKRAMDLLCKIKAHAKGDPHCMAFKRSFDETLLNWGFDHFLECGVEVRLGKKAPKDLKKSFTKITRDISKEIIKIKYVFTHRDYQSRNLMIHNSNIYTIDFQDALMGPEAYDLVSLARDSYVDISDELLDKLISYYCASRELDVGEFKDFFDLVTIQRKLKDAGRFVYIDKVKGNSSFLQHIPRSLNYVKKALQRQKKYSKLYETLKPYVPEWKSLALGGEG